MRPKRTRTHRPMLESLEIRLVPSGLSASRLQASPDVALSQARLLSDASPASPGGFSPSQISQAYGFNQITFDNGTVEGNGSGQTIAIVDAYDQPNIASDLATFDSTFGLPAPPSFVKVNENGGTTYPSADPRLGTRDQPRRGMGPRHGARGQYPARRSQFRLLLGLVHGGGLCPQSAGRGGRVDELGRR